MEKNSKSKSVIAVLLAVILIILLVGAWAFARYTTTLPKVDGTATVAKWSFKTTGLDSFARTDTVALTDIAEGKLAPGTKGKIQASVDATGCEVGVDYTVSVTDVVNKPENLKFYSDADCQTEIAIASGKYSVTGTIDANADTKTVAPAIYWKWDYNTTANTAVDTADTANGEAAKTMTFKVEAIGTQSNPNN